ncbi:MAG TPA: prepilin-type N-terminal cleavage/methylation domain-containing protein [Acidobacteria bacterium]|nr:prepilin-type N-terminal cleavage/methylation domain-containing protein [Acidobacteriota bacterium]
MSRKPVLNATSSRLLPSERGFSLVEMLAVLAIVGLTAAIGVYSIDLAGWRCSSACSDIARRLELARSRAIFEQNDYRIVFDTSAHTFQVHDDENSNGSIDTDISEAVTTYYASTQGAGTVFGYPSGTKGIDGSNISAAISFPGSPPVLTFDPLGSAVSGVIYLIPTADLDRSDPTHMRAISVNQATGRVRRWRYDADVANPGPWRLEQ